jgi:hypothetical protein
MCTHSSSSSRHSFVLSASSADAKATRVLFVLLLYHGVCLRCPETTVVVRSSLPTWCGLEPDSLVVQSLDVGNTKVIGQVLGQSVALDHYNR